MDSRAGVTVLKAGRSLAVPLAAQSRARWRYWIAISASFAIVLLLDLWLVPGDIAAALYVVPVFLTTLSGRMRWFVNTTIGAVVATLLGFIREEVMSADSPDHPHPFTRITIAVMIVGAGAIGALLITRSNRLQAVSIELMEASVAIEKQAQLLKAASAIGKVAGWSFERGEGAAIAWSDEVERIFGMPEGERTLPADALALVDDADDRDRLLDTVRTCLTEGTPFVETFRATSIDGRRLWVTVMGEATRDGEGGIVGVAGAIQDVTLWKEAEATATAQRRRFAQFANSVPSVIWTAEPSGTIDYFSDALVDYTGKRARTLLGDQWVSVLHPDDVEHTVERWSRAIEAGEPYLTSFRLRRADGEYRWFRVAARPERGDDGSVIKWWGHADDVHEYFLLEQEASKLAQERHDILESIGDGVVTLDSDMRFVYVNGNAEALLQQPAAALVGAHVWDTFIDAKGTALEDAFTEAIATGETRRFTYWSPTLLGWFEGSASPTPQGLTVYFRDVTELKTMSEQLAQAQRMESVGRLTGGIAHDFNNLLTVVMGGVEALNEEPALTEEGRTMLELVASAAGRGAELTHELLAFSRQQPLSPQVVDVAARIREMTPILSRAIGPGITEVSRLDEGLPSALVDPAQLESALLNLAINAGDAMRDGGTLTITAELVEVDESYTTMHAEVLPGSYILVSVSDTGTGISEEHLPHIFEPFFTTKGTGEGSGLGLAMVWGFAKQTGGHVTVYSEEGIGSTFHLYLPIAPANAPSDAPVPAAGSDARRGSGHILVAEDDPLVQQFAAERLRDHGYTVTVANTGAEALELLDGIADLRLLFTDVIMKGGMSGRELADLVVSRRPGTPVLYASGYTEDVMMHQGRLDPDVALLAKPYSGRHLIERVHSVIGDDAEGDGA